MQNLAHRAELVCGTLELVVRSSTDFAGFYVRLEECQPMLINRAGFPLFKVGISQAG